MKHKYQKPNRHRTHNHIVNVNTRNQEKHRINNKNHEWIEDYITIPKESRLEKSQGRYEKVYKLLKHIPTDNVTELNELIYAGAELVSDKIDISEGMQTEIQNLDG